MSKVIKNASQAHGYKYTSLADLAVAGVNIPKMRVHPSEFGEFIEYWDGERWETGARIVPLPPNARMNEAQAYGAALTYARRYTVQMAESVACDDDKNVELAEPTTSRPSTVTPTNSAKPSAKQVAWLLKFYTEKMGKTEGEAKVKIATFKTIREASAEIERLMSEEGHE